MPGDISKDYDSSAGSPAYRMVILRDSASAVICDSGHSEEFYVI